MIGFLSGTIKTISTDRVILLVNGVGYLVTLSPNLLSTVKKDQPTELFIYTHVREDALDLYGFSSQEELGLFQLVLTVSGIGPKTALLVIDRGVGSIEHAIKEADTSFFTTIPRLGLKNAQKIIIELKNKLGGLKELNLSPDNEDTNQAVEALCSMGYSRQEALKAVHDIPDSEVTLERKVSYALRQIGKAKLNTGK